MIDELRIGSSTHTGQVRHDNEDSLVVAPPVYAVADGMGGHLAGEVASAIAVDTLRALLAGTSPISSPDELIDAVHSANLAIFHASYESPERRGMGTTLTALGLLAPEADGEADRLVLVNVGDSRAYRLRGDQLRQLSVDHSYVHELVASGQISAEEARHHPNRNIVTRALGIEPDVAVDAWTLPLVRGDRFLLCSDGLVDEVTDATITEMLRTVPDPQRVADELVATANRHGGRDNVSVLVVDVTGGRAAPVGATDDDVEPYPPGSITDTARNRLRVDDTPPPTQQLPLSAIHGAPPGDDHLDDGPTSSRSGAPASAPPVPPAPPRPPKPPKFTWRTLLFAFAVGAVFSAGLSMTAVYARSGYFVGWDGDTVVVYKGRKDKILWFGPTVARPTDTTRDLLSEAAIHSVDNRSEFSSLDKAIEYVKGLNSLGPPAAQATTTTTTPGEPATTTPTPPSATGPSSQTPPSMPAATSATTATSRPATPTTRPG